MDFTEKHIVIIEGADATGKTSLTNFIQNTIANGKCHVLHSNFNKSLPANNHRRQHRLIAKFVVDNFSPKYYTGNNVIILDRNYISDIVYGTIGYGSGGTLPWKINYLCKLMRKLKKSKAQITFIYCRPSKKNFDPDAKEELLTNDEDQLISLLYDQIVIRHILPAFKDIGIKCYFYDYTEDPDYLKLDAEVFCTGHQANQKK